MKHRYLKRGLFLYAVLPIVLVTMQQFSCFGSAFAGEALESVAEKTINQPSLPAGVGASWLSLAKQDIEKRERQVTLQERDSFGRAFREPHYHIVNRGNDLRSYFDGQSWLIQPRDQAAKWEWRYQFMGVSRGGVEVVQASVSEVLVAGEKIRYLRGNGVEEFYENRLAGFKQGFVLNERPLKAASGLSPVRLRGVVSGSTTVETAALGESRKKEVRFANGSSLVLKLGGLKVVDARGEEVTSWFEVKRVGGDRVEGGVGYDLDIVLEDDRAHYPLFVDPLATTPNWSAESDEAYAEFGWSVSTAGDVNGDGFSDVIVGSPYFDNGQSDEGASFVYYGSTTGLSTTANWTAEGDQANSSYGYSVSTAGDVNGDGFSDVIVGARFFDNGETNEGACFVYYGSSTGLSLSADWTAESGQVSAQFGFSVSTAGDVNGDGVSDVIVGARYFDNGESNEGASFVYYGSSSGLLLTPAWTADSNQANAELGYAVSTAGDVNGDGFGDVIVGAPYFDNGQSDEGASFVYYGSSSGLSTTANWISEGDQSGAWFGWHLSTAGDVNGDGYSDVIVGAPYFDNGQSDEGVSFVYYGSSSGLSTAADWTAESNQANAWFGYSVSTAGDVNGDGFSDVIVGSLAFDNGESNEGTAFVYFGSDAGLSTTADWTAEIDQAQTYFGNSVSGAGDVNGDGFNDVIVGAWGFANGQTDEGGSFVYYGSSFGLSVTADWAVESNQANAQFGVSVSTAGDVNGDGYSDVIVGADLFDNGQVNEGGSFVYYGSSSGLSTTADWIAEGDQANAQFGLSVGTAGDVNGDGFSDVIVGAPYLDNGQTDEGASFVYYGSATGLSISPAWAIESDHAGALFGSNVGTAGDVNGDGFSDVIVGAPYFDNGEAGEGTSFVYHGSATGLNTTAAWTAESNQVNAQFGYSVSTAGDVNGDGYSDVIVGAIFYSNGQSGEGASFVYYGSATGLSTTADWTAESDQDGALFGFSVGSAGDVNGDGYSDIIVGAVFFDQGQVNEGASFVYYGSATGPAVTASWSAESNQSSAGWGASVSTAGDVNGDGLSDIIIGVPYFTNGQSSEGATFVYYGATSGLPNTADWTAESDQAGAGFGFSVSTAGDVNGDGFSDIVVGSYVASNGQSSEGASFVYYGNSRSGLNVAPLQQNHSQEVIQTLGSTTNGTFYPVLHARAPAGRTRARMIYEVKPLGSLFDNTGLGHTGFTDIGITGTTISVPVTGLVPDSYHWRARLQYFPSMNFSRWYSIGNNGSNETDFLMLPSPTPTLVPSSTNTPTSTPTPTNTLTSTPASLPTKTSTPTLAPTVTSVPTLIPTSSPTATPTSIPTMTPLPTVPTSNIAGKIIDNFNRPLSGILIYVVGQGVAVTNEQGFFSLVVKGENQSFEVLVNALLGGLDEERRFVLERGIFSITSLGLSNDNSLNCAKTDHSGALLEAIDLVDKIQQLARNNNERLRSQQAIAGRVATLWLTAIRRYEAALESFSMGYPVQTLDCSVGSNSTQACKNISLRPKIKMLVLRLKQQRRVVIRGNNLLRERGQRRLKQAATQRRTLRRFYRNALRQITSLSDNTYTCLE